jgi:hypothetical protein
MARDRYAGEERSYADLALLSSHLAKKQQPQAKVPHEGRLTGSWKRLAGSWASTEPASEKGLAHPCVEPTPFGIANPIANDGPYRWG